MQQLTPLATYSALSHYWAIITHEGLSGLVTIKQPLTAILNDCLAAHVTILCETASMFLLIIHDHRQKNSDSRVYLSWHHTILPYITRWLACR